MKHILWAVFLSGILIMACSKKEKSPHPLAPTPIQVDTLLEIPNTTVDKSELQYNNKESLWKLNDQLYSGYAVSFYQDSLLKEKVGILNGRKQNQMTQWYPDGHYKQVAHYHKGKLHGKKKLWSSDSNHLLIAHLNYNSGKAHGRQRKWYPSGELFKNLNLHMGREEGLQQAFRKNGDLYANYEAKEGRIFGLKKAALCFGLEDENVQHEK